MSPCAAESLGLLRHESAQRVPEQIDLRQAERVDALARWERAVLSALNARARHGVDRTKERRDKTGMEERMKEPYAEGLATHGDPESCGGDREVAAEALTGAHAGRALSRENHSSGRRRRFCGRKATRPRARAEQLVDGPARSETPGMRGTSMRENREIP